MEQFNSILQLHNQIESLSFDTFIQTIQQKQIIQTTSTFLHYLNITTVRPQHFLTLYVIYGYRDHILTNTNLSKQLFKHSTSIIKDIQLLLLTQKNSPQLQSQIKKNLLNFINLFNQWKKEDLTTQINYYCDSYWELETIKKQNAETVYHTEINKIQFKLKKQIESLDKKNGLSFLNNYESTYLQKQKKEHNLLKTKITKTMKRAYWNHITLLLQQNPPDLSWIPNMLKDINKRFIKLVPNNKEFQQKINDYIDYDFLGTQIINGHFEFTSIFSLADFMLDTLQELGIPSKDNEIKELKIWVSKNKKNPTFKLHLFLPKLFKEILNRIEEIDLIIHFLKNKK